MNFIDMFSGIGGFRLGMERAGHKCLAFCEIDKFAIQSYKSFFNTKNETQWHDIREIKESEIDEFGKRNRVDIICGGFPCQSFSVAGKRKGFSDTRGTLFFELARFAKILQPKYLLFENVRGLISHDGGETFKTILYTLHELGYDAEWQVLNSKDFGVPQSRQRVYIIGHNRRKCTRQIFPIIREGGENPCKLEELTHGKNQGMRLYSPKGISVTLSAHGGGWGAKTGLYGFIDLSENNVKITDFARCIQSRYNKGYSRRAGECTGVMIAPVLTPDRINKRQNGRRMKDFGEPMFTLTVQDRHGVAIVDDQGRNNKKLNLKDCVPTLRAQSHGNEPKIISNMKIRKLTPKECWRLQGFPDDYFDCAKKSGLSDSQLYKQAGNAVTVNVVYEIAKKLCD